MSPFGPWPGSGTAGAGNLPFPWFVESAETEGTFSTSSMVMVTALTLTTSALLAGTYRIDWYGETSQDVIGASSSLQCTIDAAIAGVSRHGDDVDILDVLARPGFRIVALGAGVHTILLQLASTAGTAVNVRRRRLAITRVG